MQPHPKHMFAPSSITRGRSGPGEELVCIAGYDGTRLGRAVVREAGRRAGPTGTVFVVYAYRSSTGVLATPRSQRRASSDRDDGRRALAQLQSEEAELPQSQYVPELLAGAPAEAIARVARVRGADEIVIGESRRRGHGLRRRVSDRLARRASAPVVTVPRAAAGVPPSDTAADRDPEVVRETDPIPDASTWW